MSTTSVYAEHERYRSLLADDVLARLRAYPTVGVVSSQYLPAPHHAAGGYHEFVLSPNSTAHRAAITAALARLLADNVVGHYRLAPAVRLIDDASSPANGLLAETLVVHVFADWPGRHAWKRDFWRFVTGLAIVAAALYLTYWLLLPPV